MKTRFEDDDNTTCYHITLPTSIGTKLSANVCSMSSMKLTARNLRNSTGVGLSKFRNHIGENWYDRNYGQCHDATIGKRSKRKYSTLGSTYIRRLQLQWGLSTPSFKRGVALLALWISLLVLLRIWDSFFQIRVGSGEYHYTAPSNFAVVINTFRRPDRLQQTVRHYAETCGKKSNVGQVFVVWADQEERPPSSGALYFDDSARHLALRGNATISNRVPIDILKKEKDSLNARFEPIPQLKTTSVFMVDDDIRVDCNSLYSAFAAWQRQPDSMVGFYPRLSSPPKSSFGKDSSQKELVYHAWPKVYWRQKFNIILTKASFLHSDYLELYTNDEIFPKEIKDHVDLHRNCEDIAMSMLVAHYSKLKNNKRNSGNKNTRKVLPAPPIYAEGSVSDVGLFGGISSGTGHFATRTECLTQLTEILRSKGWDAPLEDVFDLYPSSVLQHSPGFWWQSAPSNVFEWFGLANIFS